MITLDYSDDYSEFEYSIDIDDIHEFLLNFSKEEAESLAKELNYNIEEEDLYDILQDIAYEHQDYLKDTYEDELKEFFEDDAMDQKDYISSDEYSYRGLSRKMFF